MATFRERITELSGLPTNTVDFRTNLAAITGNGDIVYIDSYSEDATLSISDDDSSISISSDDGSLSLISDEVTISINSIDSVITINDNDTTSCL